MDKINIMDKNLVHKLEAKVGKFGAENGAVVNTSSILDKENLNKEFTQVRMQASKSSVYNFFISKSRTIEKDPENFQFPTMSLSQLIVYWFCRDKLKNIIPFCLLCRKGFKTKTMRNYLTKMQHMMNIVKIAGTREGVWIDQKHYQRDVKQCINLFKAIDVKYFKYPKIGTFCNRNRLLGRQCLICQK